MSLMLDPVTVTAPISVIPTSILDACPTVPATPASLGEAAALCPEVSERLLATITPLGFAFGYPREQDGRLVQDLFPIESTSRDQVSTSSLVDLGMHTETAFHPYKPDYVVLLCLRGDPMAETTHAAIDDIVSELDDDTLAVLRQPRFVTTVDESFRTHGESDTEFVVTPITGDGDAMRLVYDEVLMRGTDPKAERALAALTAAIKVSTRSTVLRTGDLLIIDNHRAVHGRSRFTPRFDGTDRWLRRVMVIATEPPGDHVDGHLITTTF
jgi:L-asparagine oxygenase